MKRTRRLGTSPRRLSRGDPESLETRLVREARREAPPAGASRRALLALGLVTTATAATVAKTAEAALSKAVAENAVAAKGAVEAVATTVAVAKGATVVGAAAAPVAATGKGLFGLSLTTWLAGGAIAIATTVGVVEVTSAPSSPAPSAAMSAPQRAPQDVPSGAVAPTGSPIADPAPQPPPEPAVSSTSRVVPAPSSPTVDPIGPADDETEAPAAADPPLAPAPAPASSTLGREVALVDGARAALANGDPASALSMLDTYDREFPAGTLAPESARLRAKAKAARAAPR